MVVRSMRGLEDAAARGAPQSDRQQEPKSHSRITALLGRQLMHARISNRLPTPCEGCQGPTHLTGIYQRIGTESVGQEQIAAGLGAVRCVWKWTSRETCASERARWAEVFGDGEGGSA